MPTSRPTILILTSPAGGGHLNLAQALSDILSTRYHVTIVDPQPGMTDRFYTTVSRRFVNLLHWQYAWTDHSMAALGLQNMLKFLSRKQFSDIIAHVQPQLIITTHALVSYVAARANEYSGKRVPLVFQLTDLGRLHMTWFSEKHADAYLAPTREIFAQTLEHGIAKNRVHLTGRPVRHQFLAAVPHGRDETLAALHFDPTLLTIFLQGGAKGSARVDRTLESMLATKVPVQIILAVGNNREMAARYANTEQVRVLPFTERIAPYMAAADVIAGKAGASSISEAFTLEKPFLATAFIPGQETPNLQFIERHNLGWICLQATTLQGWLTQAASNPGMIAEKVKSIRAYKVWNMQANLEIGLIIDRLLSREREQTSGQ